MKQLVIIVCGKRRSGKTTVTKWLETSFGAVAVSITGPLRAMTAKLWDLLPDQVEGAAKDVLIESLGGSPRQLMIKLSAIIKHELGHDIWITHVVNALDDQPLFGARIACVDGVRLKSEADTIKRAARNRGRETLIVKTECIGDEPSTNALEQAVDEITPDVLVRWSRGDSPMQSIENILRETHLMLIAHLQTRPELIEIFDPGGPDPDQVDPGFVVNIKDE